MKKLIKIPGNPPHATVGATLKSKERVDLSPRDGNVIRSHCSEVKSSPVTTAPPELHLLLEDKPELPKPKPATWLSRDPDEPWCPPNLKEFLDLENDYKNELHRHEKIMGEWMVTAATKRGRMHAHHGTFREDAYCWNCGESFAIYCVCDGAGSAQLSRIGSEFTARTICRLVSEELLLNQQKIQACSADSLHANLKSVLHHAVAQTASQLCEMANKGKCNANDFRCTILTALHYSHPSGGFYVFGNVGDGFIGLKRRGGEAERVGVSDSGSFSGEVLCFMPDRQVGEYYNNSLDRLPMFSDEEAEGVLICTDGIEDPFFPVHKNIAALYEQLELGFEAELCGVSYPDSARPTSVFNSSKPGEELLKWLNFEKRGENDDRTIMLVRKRASPLSRQIPDPVGKIASPDEKCSGLTGIGANSSALRTHDSLKIFLMLLVAAMLGFVIGFVFGRFTGRAVVVEALQNRNIPDASRLCSADARPLFSGGNRLVL